jgi:hypothetical protein
MLFEFSLATVRCLSVAFAAFCCIVNIFDSERFKSNNMLIEEDAFNTDDAPATRTATRQDIHERYCRILNFLKFNRKRSQGKRARENQMRKSLEKSKNQELLKFFSALPPFLGELFSLLQLVISVLVSTLSCFLMFLGKAHWKLGFIIFLLVPFLNFGSEITNFSKVSVQLQLQNGFLPDNHSFAPIARVSKYIESKYMFKQIR